MTRDIRDRLDLFGVDLDLRRLALNMDQVEQYEPPPNPAKESDSRFAGYIQAYGDESWELDALEPDVLAGLVRREVEGLRNENTWEQAEEAEADVRRVLGLVAERSDDVATFVEDQ